MTWQTLLAVGAAVVAVGAYIWYKVKADAVIQSNAAIVQAQIDQANATTAALQAQQAADNQKAQDALQTEISQVLAVPDPAAKLQAALDLLTKLRGVN